MENNEQQEEGILQEPLQEIQPDNAPQQLRILQEPLQEIQPDNAPPQLVRRSSRPHKSSQGYCLSNYILLTDEGESNCFQETCQVEHSEEWKKAMEEEMKSLLENKIWELVNLPKVERLYKTNGCT